jgi:hypothetical protein
LEPAAAARSLKTQQRNAFESLAGFVPAWSHMTLSRDFGEPRQVLQI